MPSTLQRREQSPHCLWPSVTVSPYSRLQHNQNVGNRIAVLIMLVNGLLDLQHGKSGFGCETLHIVGAVLEAAALGKSVMRGNGIIGSGIRV